MYLNPQNLILTEEKKMRETLKSKNDIVSNKFITGDVVQELKKIPDRSIDLIIADPPYWKVINEHWDYKWRTENDYAKWCLEWLSELARVVRLSGSFYLFGYMRNLVYLYKDILNLGFIFRQQLIINKGIKAIGGRATKGYKIFPNVTESLLLFVYDSKPFIKEFLKKKQEKLGLSALEINKQLDVKTNGGGVWSLYTGDNILAQVPTEEMWSRLQKVLKFKMPHKNISQTFNIEMGITDVWSDINFNGEKRFHPAQKPVKLLRRIIYASSDKGMTVLDPMMGVGSSAVASKLLNRNFIGIEKEKKYVDIAKRRMKEIDKYKEAAPKAKILF